MNRDELLDRIKSEVILREGEIREHEWRQIGLLTEAVASGISERDFFQLVQDVSRKVDSDLPRITSLGTKIKEAAERSNRQLTEEDLKQFVSEAERLQLPRTFVEKKWIPQIVSTVPIAAVEEARLVPDPQSSQQRKPVQREKPATNPVKTKSRQAGFIEKGQPISNEFENSQLFIDQNSKQLYTPVQEPALEHPVKSFLRPVGATLSNVDLWRRLLNTSLKWSGIFFGLVWKVLAFITVSAFNAILAFGRLLGRAEFWRATASLIRVAMVVGIGWWLWSWYSNKVSKAVPGPTNVATVISTKAPRHSKKHKKGKSHSVNYALASTKAGAGMPAGSQPNVDGKGSLTKTNAPDSSLSVAQSNQSAVTSRQYDSILDRVGQFGERPAAKNGKWGLWANDRWFIQPEYDEIDVFKNNVATVRLNGQLFNIGRRGNQIREED